MSLNVHGAFFMKNLISIISLFLCISLNAQKSVVKSQWFENTEEDPDTSGVSWIRPQKATFGYSVLNNSKYVYFLMKVSDKVLQERILKDGMTLWINMNNEGKKELGIHFPLGSLNSGSRSIPGIQDDSKDTKKPGDLVALANTIELIGFRSEELRKFPSENADTFTGSVNMSSGGILYYRMKMPAEKIPLRNSKDRKGAMPFTIGIESGSGKPYIYWIKNIRLSTGN